MNTNQKKIVIFSGPPGSGKGSLSHLCTEKFKWTALSTGNLCRKHIAEGTVLGKQMAAAINAGKLTDDHVISSMVGQWLQEQGEHNQGVILDGFPRTVPQAEYLCAFVRERLPDHTLTVVHLDISEDHVVKRLGGRATCNNNNCQAVYSLLPNSQLQPAREMICNKCSSALTRRADDGVEAIKERLKTYYKHERALIDYFEQSKVDVKRLLVERALPEIFVDLSQLFGQE